MLVGKDMECVHCVLTSHVKTSKYHPSSGSGM
jgi:hypothetical protein